MSKAIISDILTHWQMWVDRFPVSPLEFYARIETEIGRVSLPVKLSRVFWREGRRILSARREYLRVQRGRLVFDICAAPFGRGAIVSWWLGRTPPSLWSEVPHLGEMIEHLLGDTTYLEVDRQAAFQQAVHECVMATIKTLPEIHEVPAEEQIPMMPEFFSEEENKSGDEETT